jgi:hypothetical protein
MLSRRCSCYHADDWLRQRVQASRDLRSSRERGKIALNELIQRVAVLDESCFSLCATHFPRRWSPIPSEVFRKCFSGA